jgi:hypothetical protein
MNETISHVIQALDAVEERFYGLDNFAYADGSLVNGGEARKLERRFMIAFSQKFAAVMGENGDSYSKVEYDFEVPKRFIWSDYSDPSILRTFEKLSTREGVDMSSYFETQPDFLVHEGQGSSIDQRLIIEAKTNPNTSRQDALKDIFHVMIYSNCYHFSANVLLLINVDMQKWLGWLTHYQAESYYMGHRERLKDIFVVSKSSSQSPSTAGSLASYLEA